MFSQKSWPLLAMMLEEADSFSVKMGFIEILRVKEDYSDEQRIGNVEKQEQMVQIGFVNGGYLFRVIY